MVGIWKFIALCIVAAVAAAGTTLALHFVGISDGAESDISYAEFLSVTLTALSIMITVLGLFVAAAGVIGWSTLENKLRSHSVEYFTNQLSKEGPLRQELEELFTSIAYTGIEGLKQSHKEDRPYDD